MSRPYQWIRVEKVGPVACVSLITTKINDFELEEVAMELARLIDEDGHQRVVLNLGPEDPDCLYSVFLAKLISFQRRLETHGGKLALAHLSERTQEIFRVAGLEKFFQFYSTQAAAVAAIKD